MTIDGGIERNESDVTPVGGGGEPTLGDLSFTFGIEFATSAHHRAGGTTSADWRAVLESCALRVTETPGVTADTDSTIVVIPERAPNIPSNNAGVPKVASVTFRDAGLPAVAQVWRTRDVVSRLASFASGSEGELRLAFESIGLWFRSSPTPDVADAITTATLASLTAGPSYLSRALQPQFRLAGAAFTVDGGSAEVAELLGDVCVQEFSFDPGMSLEAQPCLEQIDGYAPAFSYQTGQAVLSLTVSIPEEDGTDKAVIAAMLRELSGDYLSLAWTRVSGPVTWTLTLRLNRFRILSVVRGDAAGARTYQIEVGGRPDPAADTAAAAPWSLTWTRVETP
jgi:hypothetical protein